VKSRAVAATLILGTLALYAHANEETASAVFERFGLVPAPEIVMAKDFSEGLTHKEFARAVVYNSGREVIILSERIDRDHVKQMIEHEAAHLRAWRDYGYDIEPHGREWKRTCRKYARINSSACTPDH
jgi:hypothetical protein